MSINFLAPLCQTHSNKKIFGLCDEPSPNKNPAYIDEKDGAKWIAVVENEYVYQVTFTAIDNCIEINRPDGKMEKRCDGVLTYNSSVIFVELKERGVLGNKWVKDGEEQIRTSINHFEANLQVNTFTSKKAYIANSQHPKFKESQSMRMEKFFSDTGYVLRIENRIKLQ